VVIIILLGVCWKFLGPGIMRRLLRPRRCPSGEQRVNYSRFLSACSCRQTQFQMYFTSHLS
jgi:hypothetical protein